MRRDGRANGKVVRRRVAASAGASSTPTAVALSASAADESGASEVADRDAAAAACAGGAVVERDSERDAERARVQARSGEGRKPPSCARLSVATSFRRRAQGLLLSGPRRDTLLLVPCSDVHTVGMSRDLDIAFVDADGLVVESCRRVRPLARLRNAKAEAVLERFASDAPWFEAGDRLGIGRALQGEGFLAANVAFSGKEGA